MKKKVVLAFSGGLDTTYCALWLREQGFDVHTVTVMTDAYAPAEVEQLAAHAARLGVVKHTLIDGRQELFDDYLKNLIFANALRGDAYPLCVSVERVVQARVVARHAAQIHADALAHGSTGAGNDQVRFDVAFRVFAPGVTVITPIRDQALTREQTTDYLNKHGIHLPPKTSRYSVNRGLWGTTIGGVETHVSDGVLPEDVYLLTSKPWPAEAETIQLQFDCGIPTSLDSEKLDPITLIDSLNHRAGRHGVGRGMHVGDTILGIKGRVAFEAPAAAVLIPAHRELEKLVLSRQQQMWKRTLGDQYGAMLHEARAFDPLMRDIEAFLVSSQQRVSGTVSVRVGCGQATILGATSPHSLMNASKAKYGESSALWTGAEAAAFSKIYGMQDCLLAQSVGTGE